MGLKLGLERRLVVPACKPSGSPGLAFIEYEERARVQALRSAPPGEAAGDPDRSRVFGAALQQFDELLTAAQTVGPPSAPLPLFYALSQAGRAIAAARCHFFERLHEAWKPGDSVTLGEVRAAGDKVMFSFRWRAIGDVSGIETTLEWMAVDTFRDGLIARMQIFSDRAEALEALDISE